MNMGLKDVVRSIREYPTAYAELEKVRAELRQTKEALEKSKLCTKNHPQIPGWTGPMGCPI